jgi:hypothetical protein
LDISGTRSLFTALWRERRRPEDKIMEQVPVPFDLTRMFVGDAPWLYYLEILVRVAIVYTYTLALLRWIGSRTIAQLSTVEFLLVIALGSAVGDSMFSPEVPLLHALLVITAVILLNKGIDLLLFNSGTMKNVIDGQAVEVVRNGCIVGEGLENRNMTASEVHEMLRLKGISNMGEVAIAHIEASGQLSLVKRDEPQLGLPLIPILDVPGAFAIRNANELKRGKPYACAHCGITGQPPPVSDEGCCVKCGHAAWVPASLGPGDPTIGAAKDRSARKPAKVRRAPTVAQTAK